jgi:hypothetical protein
VLVAGTPAKLSTEIFQNVAHFSPPEITPPNTTNSPSKHHIKVVNFPKPHPKTPEKQQKLPSTTTQIFSSKKYRFRIEEWTGRANGSAPSLKLPWRKIK